MTSRERRILQELLQYDLTWVNGFIGDALKTLSQLETESHLRSPEAKRVCQRGCEYLEISRSKLDGLRTQIRQLTARNLTANGTRRRVSER
jgi:hypothetical protein